MRRNKSVQKKAVKIESSACTVWYEDPELDVFAPVASGPGKRGWSIENLFSRRDSLIRRLEPFWAQIGWQLQSANSPEAIFRAFQPIADQAPPGPLAPIFRASCEPATIPQVNTSRKILEAAKADELKVEDAYQTEFRKFHDVERAFFEMQYPITEMKERENLLRALRIEITSKKGEVRRAELKDIKKMAANKTPTGSDLSKLRDELSSLELKRDECTKVSGELRKRRLATTPEHERLLNEELEKRRLRVGIFEQDRVKVSLKTTQVREKLLDQEACVFRAELYDFIRRRRKTLTPRKVANAMAGLPYMKCRRSVERLSKYRSQISVDMNYMVFKFLESLWKRRVSRSKVLLEISFRQGIVKLSRTIVIDHKKVENPLRKYLTDNWYYLAKAIEETQRERLEPERMPFRIATKLEKYVLGLAATEGQIMAERYKIID